MPKILSAKYPSVLITLRIIVQNQCVIPFENFLKSAFAMMHQKYDSLLGFDNERVDKIRCHNLEKMYYVKDGKVPSDSRMREVVDGINPADIRKPFKELFSIVQRNGALNGFKLNFGKLKDYYLMPIDGTGLFIQENVAVKIAALKTKERRMKLFTIIYWEAALFILIRKRSSHLLQKRLSVKMVPQKTTVRKMR